MIWLVIALIAIAIGFIAGIVAEICFGEIGFGECLVGAFGVCLVEGVVYAFTKLIAWVAGWNADLVVKISFVAMPIILVLIAVIAIIELCIYSENKYNSVYGILVTLFIASAITCAAFAWISSIGWRIGVLVFSGIAVISILVLLNRFYRGGYAVSYGPSCECVEYYASRRDYKRKQRERAKEDEYRRYSLWY